MWVELHHGHFFMSLTKCNVGGLGELCNSLKGKCVFKIQYSDYMLYIHVSINLLEHGPLSKIYRHEQKTLLKFAAMLLLD